MMNNINKIIIALIGIVTTIALYNYTNLKHTFKSNFDKRINYSEYLPIDESKIKALPKNTRFNDIINTFGRGEGKDFEIKLSMGYYNKKQPDELILFNFDYVNDTTNPKLKSVWASKIGGTARWLWPLDLVNKSKNIYKLSTQNGYIKNKTIARQVNKVLDFENLIQKLEKLTNQNGFKYLNKNIYYVHMPANESKIFLKKHYTTFLKSGGYLFYLGYECNKIGIAHAKDIWTTIRIMGTDGINYGHETDDVISWLKQINEKDKIFITTIDVDLVGGYFVNKVKNRTWLSNKIYKFCPDFVDQGIGLDADINSDPYKLVENYFTENQYFGFWWD